VEKEQYDMTRYGRESPLVPFFHTSCMDCPKPHVGDGPCCSVGHRSAFTPTIVEGNEQSQAKQDATQVMYESDAAVSQFLSLHYGPIDKVVGSTRQWLHCGLFLISGIIPPYI